MDGPRRKVATLLSANVARHGQRIDAADPRTAAALDSRRELFRQLVTAHSGREFGSVGDSRIVEFPSTSSALQFAIEIQQAFDRDNGAAPERRRIELRIGISVGEVIEDDQGQLYGTGIDAAIRVQELTIPGGISLTGQALEHIDDKDPFEFTGRRKIEGIAGAVPTYQVLAPGVARAHLPLWAELRRRNVFRVGAAYVVVAWLLIQVASIVLPAFESPPWAMRTVVVSVVLCFPLALVLAWIYELTPLGLMRSDEVFRRPGVRRLTGRQLNGVIIGLLVVAVVVLAFEHYVSFETEGASPPQESIAVLAFENLSPDPNNEYFSDGVADELLNVLARIPELRVASRTSSFSFKGRNEDAGSIAASLMVDNVLEGSVRREGDRVRVTATLIHDGIVLWTEAYDRSLDDVLDVQSEIAFAVASAIIPVLSPASRERIEAHPTSSIEAYDYYLSGIDYLNRPDELETLESAAELFTRAIDIDPRFAAAWAARCKARLGQYEFTARLRDYFGEAQSDCLQAWTLDNGMWEVRVALGRLYRLSGLLDDALIELEAAVALQPAAVEAFLELGSVYAEQRRPEQAELMFQRAIEADRGNWNVYRLYGHFLYDNQRYREAAAQYSRVVEFTPDSGIGYDNLANAYWALGDFDRAATAFQSSLTINPSRWAYSNLGSMQYYLGDFDAAVDNQLSAIDLAPDNHEAWGRLADAYRYLPGRETDARSAYANAVERAERQLVDNPRDALTAGLLGLYYAYLGRRQQAADQIERALELAPDDPNSHYFKALINWHFGDRDVAYSELELAVDRGFPRVFLRTEPDFAPLREEAAFLALSAGGSP